MTDRTPQRASFPRSWPEWRACIRDAWTFGERVSPPVALGRDLGLRAGLLGAVLAVTALFISLLAMPGVAVVGKSARAMADRFSDPIGSIELPAIAQRSVVLDRNGETIATITGLKNSVFTPLKKVPRRVREAIIATEDAKFYQHSGVDLAGLMRAMFLNVRSGRARQGGSTITQQLVKNTLVGTEKTVDRKIREARIAVRLEQVMTKDQILEAYLNQAYFGNGAYGIGAAAEFYFGKDVSELSIPQGAMLAGIIKAPSEYEPIGNPKDALSRRNTALQRMADVSFITPKDARAAMARPLGAKPHPLPPAKNPYFVEYAKRLILDDPRFGETVAEREKLLLYGGLRIHTTLDNSLQRAARKANTSVLNLKGDPASALVSIEPSTGAVRAMYGGKDFDESKFNLAVQGRRQPGSTFKPVTLVAALEAGISPATMFDTPSPLEIVDPGDGKKKPVHNYDRKGRGYIDMREATYQSVNTYYVQLIQKVGPAKVAEMGERLGITGDLPSVISLALGTVEVPPFELASVYATLANKGVYCKPYAITKVTDGTGATLLDAKPDCEKRIEPEIAAEATSILQGVIEQGTGRTNARIGRPAAGKTGTTDEYKDSWFAGYTPQFATVVWLGFPDDTKRSLYNIHGYKKVFGGSLPAMIWARYMRAAHEDLQTAFFPKPPPAGKATVPNVVDLPLADATKKLEEAGFYGVKIVEAGSSKPDGTVLAQDPPAEAEVEAGALITLTVSGEGAPAPAPSPSPTPTPSTSPKPSPTPTATPSPSPTETKKND